jgi:aminoglycoside phosphotransferase (APT) family kinase protein
VTESLTKYALTPAELDHIVTAGFGRTIDRCTELTDGSYNAAFAVSLDDGRDLVLKVAPDPSLVLLTHEVDLMRTEVSLYRQAGEVGVPVPAVVLADFTRELIATDYAFLTRVPGVSFHSVRDTMTETEKAGVRRQVATAATALNRVTGPAFGYPLRGSRTWQPTWRASFGAMVDDLLADATRLGTRLPAPPERIGAAMRRHADVLDDVTRPALVHFDLWDGNVFVSPDGGGWRVEGLIDGERAFYGDPVAELVSLALFRSLDADTLGPFMGGGPEGLGGGSLAELDGRGQRRLDLYTTYLYVIMAIEGATRGWSGPERRQFEDWLYGLLDEHLGRL